MKLLVMVVWAHLLKGDVIRGKIIQYFSKWMQDSLLSLFQNKLDWYLRSSITVRPVSLTAVRLCEGFILSDFQLGTEVGFSLLSITVPWQTQECNKFSSSALSGSGAHRKESGSDAKEIKTHKGSLDLPLEVRQLKGPSQKRFGFEGL